MKTLRIVLVVMVLALIIGSCKAKYVREKPLIVEASRPKSPGQNYVWSNDNWVFNKQNRTYTRHKGNWALPVSKKTYKQGFWKTIKNGNHWEAGGWK